MQQEYTPYGPEWAKEVKKLTKDQIINDFLRPALLKAKAETGGQSAGTWVSCSQKFPEDWITSIIRAKRNKRLITEYDISSAESEYFIMEDESRLYYEDCEWLDEAQPPDNKDREQAIGLLKTLCGLKQYKDAKGKDEYYEQQKELAWKEAFDFLKQIRQ